MSITAIIVNWNSGALLHECLSALSQQSITPHRTLVVDNASTDNSVDYAKIAPEVSVLQMPTNLGFAKGNNIALAECDTEFVVLINPDAFPQSDWLENLLLAARANPDVAAFGSRQMMDGAAGMIDGLGDVYHFSGLIWRRGYGRPMKASDLTPCEIFSPCAGAALYRREALETAGGFDEDFFCYVEDMDLGFRLRLMGYRSLLVPDAVVYHVGSATTGGPHSDFSVYHGHRNLVWAYVKNMPGLLFWLLLPLHLAMNLVTVVYFSMRGQARVILSAKWDAVLGLPAAWRKRRRIQAARKISVSTIWHALDKRFWSRY